MKNLNSLLKTSAILWVIWGLVHIFAGVMTMKGILSDDISSSIAGIADAVEPSALAVDYPEAAGAIIGQHGFNLFWIGLITFISAFFIWKGNKDAIFLAAIVGGLADLGYFLFMDLGGFVKFVPGTIMTLVSSLAIITSFYANFKRKSQTWLNRATAWITHNTIEVGVFENFLSALYSQRNDLNNLQYSKSMNPITQDMALQDQNGFDKNLLEERLKGYEQSENAFDYQNGVEKSILE